MLKSKKAMKGGLRVIGIVSIVLLFCVLIGQGVWFHKVREIKREEFRYAAAFVLRETLNDFLNQELLNKDYQFYCGLSSDGKTVNLGKGKLLPIASSEMFYKVTKGAFYDYLYRNQYLDLNQIDSLYRVALYNKGISDAPVLMIWDKTSGDNLMQTDSLTTYRGYLFTQPVDIGYECEHQVVAAFRESGVFYSLGWHLVWEGVFMLAFVACLIWQWWSMKTTWHNARVQTLGMAHLEHELRKPLATMISVLDGILSDSRRELTDIKLKKLGMMKARLLKMSDVTDTMLATMKTARLEIEREPLDIRKELEQAVEMFKTIRSHAEVHFRIQEGLKFPLLDNVYFSYVIVNLIDNGIKYAGEKPVVYVDFREEGSEYVLVVTDNGIGMPRKALKRIFSQFYRVADERVNRLSGFGLGLAFVRKVVAAYGGKIKVESEAGVGSRFTILIPSHQEIE